MPGSTATFNDDHCLAGGGRVGELMRSIDWSKSGFGPTESWSQSLQLSISLCLNSRFPLILWWGPDLLMLYNDSYTEHLQSKHPAALGKPGKTVWSEIWPTIGPMLEGVLQTGAPTWSDDLLLLLERNGFAEETYHTFSYSAIKDTDGNIVGIFTPVAETTERVISERRLRTLKDLSSARAETEDALYRALEQVLDLNHIDLPVWGLYQVDEVNSEFQLVSSDTHNVLPLQGKLGTSTFGKALGDCEKSNKLILLDSLHDFLPPLPSGIWGQVSRDAILAPVSAHKDGQTLILFSALSPHTAWNQEYESFFASLTREIVTAITEVRILEDERIRAEKLKEIDRAKTLFFSNVSHEFRTPLTLMLGPLQTAIDNESTPDPVRLELVTVHRNGLRLLKLVNSLLDFSRLEAGRIDAVYEPTDLSTLTTDLASTFRSAIEKAGLNFVVECQSTSQPAYVDRDMWEKIVLNLVSNAFKFTLEGTITVSLKEARNKINLIVADTGCGIADDEQPHIFERFHRARSAKTRTHEGTGIGLALVNELVQLHGGKIKVKSKIDQGTTFTVSIPSGKEHLPQERLGAERQLQSTATGAAPYVEEAARWLGPSPVESLDHFVESSATGRNELFDGSVSVLIADDNADMREYIERLLSPYWNVVSVGDGLTAWDLIEKAIPNLLITDVMMPGLDGFQLLERIRETQGTRMIPVIMLSARAGEESRIEGLNAGADEYLSKPFSARELVASVKANLKLSQLRNDLKLQLEQEIAERTAEAEKANEELRGIAHLVSEQIQEPSNIIASYLKLLSVRYKGRLGKDADEFIDKCLQGSRAVSRMVDDLWHYSRVDNPAITRSSMALEEALNHVERDLSEQVAATKAHIAKLGSLPVVDCNADQIEYVIKSLISNALAFARSGSVPEIQVSCVDNGHEWLFCVEDNGIGIDSMNHAEIFKPFSRLNQRPDADGTGMGLAIARKIVMAHKGWMWVESAANMGAKFFFTLPKTPPISA